MLRHGGETDTACRPSTVSTASHRTLTALRAHCLLKLCAGPPPAAAPGLLELPCWALLARCPTARAPCLPCPVLQPPPASPCLANLQADAEDLEEAGNEVMLLDDDAVPYVVGECLVHLPREEVEERLQTGGRLCAARLQQDRMAGRGWDWGGG